MNIEELFDQPCYIVDILPMQVPANYKDIRDENHSSN